MLKYVMFAGEQNEAIDTHDVLVVVLMGWELLIGWVERRRRV